jgi:hypothetical protein
MHPSTRAARLVVNQGVRGESSLGTQACQAEGPHRVLGASVKTATYHFGCWGSEEPGNEWPSVGSGEKTKERASVAVAPTAQPRGRRRSAPPDPGRRRGSPGRDPPRFARAREAPWLPVAPFLPQVCRDVAADGQRGWKAHGSRPGGSGRWRPGLERPIARLVRVDACFVFLPVHSRPSPPRRRGAARPGQTLAHCVVPATPSPAPGGLVLGAANRGG